VKVGIGTPFVGVGSSSVGVARVGSVGALVDILTDGLGSNITDCFGVIVAFAGVSAVVIDAMRADISADGRVSAFVNVDTDVSIFYPSGVTVAGVFDASCHPVAVDAV
jgi:hypothetical protein